MDTNARFVAYDLAVDAATAVLRLLEQMPRRHSDLADQGRRAVTSGPLNLGEGAARSGRDRLYHYRVALGSLREAKTAVELAVRLALVDRREGAEALELVDRCCAMAWRLVQATAK